MDVIVFYKISGGYEAYYTLQRLGIYHMGGGFTSVLLELKYEDIDCPPIPEGESLEVLQVLPFTEKSRLELHVNRWREELERKRYLDANKPKVYFEDEDEFCLSCGS